SARGGASYASRRPLLRQCLDQAARCIQRDQEKCNGSPRGAAKVPPVPASSDSTRPATDIRQLQTDSSAPLSGCLALESIARFRSRLVQSTCANGDRIIGLGFRPLTSWSVALVRILPYVADDRQPKIFLGFSLCFSLNLETRTYAEHRGLQNLPLYFFSVTNGFRHRSLAQRPSR